MNSIERLTSLFLKFPGIGARQARRFVYFLLSVRPSYRAELTMAIRALDTEVRQCAACYRFFEEKTEDSLCVLCAKSLDSPILVIVEKDIDIENIQKGGAYLGSYFVLGGLLSPLTKNSLPRLKSLFARVKKDSASKKLQEIIIALNAHPSGDYTAIHIKNTLEPVAKQYGVRITSLGRGMSTGTELEYSDTETIQQAFENRK